MASKDDIIADNTAGYQSSALLSPSGDMENVDIHERSSDDDMRPKGYHPRKQSTRSGNSFVSRAAPSESLMEELLPESMNNFRAFEVLIPKISNYIGTNLLQFFYLLMFIAGIFLCVIVTISLIVNSFKVHWSLGIFSLVYSVVIGLATFVIYIVSLRLVVEFVMSVFVIRERLTRMTLLQERR